MIPELIAHRGYSDRYPENTLTSIEAAISAGARYVEFDLQMMADDEFILMHDKNLHRTAGVHKSVFSLTRQTLRNFHADYDAKFNGQFSGTQIPLLEHVILLLKQFPDVTPLIEIKTESIDEFGVEHVMNNLLPQLSDLTRRCFLISFSKRVIGYIREHSAFKTGYVLPKYSHKYFQVAEQLQPDLLICNYRKLPAPDKNERLPGDALWPGNWQWAIYEIDDAEQAIFYGKNGVRFIETNQVGQLLQHPGFNTQTQQQVK